ncbi:uncharacterized protein LOC143764389 [Ranitomeya variabilis]|uniref:uncharacterized protein LOC143764389 n=1 Tax=Ranitomeya variabilis TaxID=490064 RepID=UPI00405789EC
MRLLVSSLFLLFLAGTYGAAIGKENEEKPPKLTLREAMKELMHDSMAIGVDLVSTWDSSEDDRLAVLGKRFETIKKSYINLAYSSSVHVVEIVKEVYNEFNETYPVYNNKVVPLLGAFAVQAVSEVRLLVEEIKPTFETFEEQMKVHQKAFWEVVLPVIKKKTKPMIDALNSSLKPYIEDVRNEVANAKGKDEVEAPSDQDPIIRTMEENYHTAENIQKVFMFDKDQWKKFLSQLELFNTNA